MIKFILINAARFIFLVLFQVLVLKNIQFSGFVNPYFYVIFIILLPFETPKWLLLFLGFLLGISIDIFSDSPGLHASATVFVAFLRPAILNLFSTRDGYEPGTLPRASFYGFAWFIKYSFFIVLSHHIVLFILEAFGVGNIETIFIRIALSTIFTMILVILSHFFMRNKY